MTASLQFHPGDRVRIVDGTLVGREGRVVEVRNCHGKLHVLVELTIFGRPVPVELESWQVKKIHENN